MADSYHWINVQKKAFVCWCNDTLKKRNTSIENVEEDFKDGTKLIAILEILTSKSIKHNRNPRMRVQKFENIELALNFLRTECKVPLVNVGPGDVHDGNIKLILGLLWSVILHFKIKNHGIPDLESFEGKGGSRYQGGKENNGRKSGARPRGGSQGGFGGPGGPGGPGFGSGGPGGFGAGGAGGKGSGDFNFSGMGGSGGSFGTGQGPASDNNTIQNFDEEHEISILVAPKGSSSTTGGGNNRASGDYSNSPRTDHSSTEMSAKEQLLFWINNQIPTYEIKNFTTDWQDGKALCALANAVEPDKEQKLLQFENDPIADCTRGVKYATDCLAIPPVMEAEDIVKYPDQLAMMTYASYFRDYSLAKVPQPEVVIPGTPPPEKPDTASNEFTPDILKCIAYGVGLEPGNEAGRETYFTIEVRNGKGRKVGRGGHDIFVKVTGPHSQINFKAHDNGDGTYFVVYTPDEDGNYVIEVKLGEYAIQNSPYHVVVAAAPPKYTDEPEPHWFVYDSEKDRWHEYDNHTNNLIEAAFKNQNFGGSIEIMSKTYKLDMTNREEINLSKKHLFGGFERRAVTRGTWFWQANDGTWAPYTEEIAVLLERHFQEGKFDDGQKFHWNKKKKNRWVQFDESTGFRQYRYEGTLKEGRPVTRGFLGNVLEKEMPKKQ